MSKDFQQISEMLEMVVGGQADNALFSVDVEPNDTKKCSTICSTSCEKSVGTEKGSVSGTIYDFGETIGQ